MDLTRFQAHDIKSLSKLKSLINGKKYYIIDVRTKEEFCSGHVCNAIHLETPLPPLKDIDIQRLSKKLNQLKIGKNDLIIVYCKLGKRAGLAKQILKYIGYKNIYSLGGVTCEPLKSLVDGKIKDEIIQICYCNVK